MSHPRGTMRSMKAWNWLMDREPIVVMMTPVVLITFGLLIYAGINKDWTVLGVSSIASITAAGGAQAARDNVYSRNTLRKTQSNQRLFQAEPEPASVNPADFPDEDLDQSWEDVLEEAPAVNDQSPPDLFGVSEADSE